MKWSMRLTALCIAGFALMLLAGTDRAYAQPLTNDDVLKLSALSLGDEVVIAKIKQSHEVAFSLEVADLERLKKDGVSKPVIAAMLERSSGVATAGHGSSPPQNMKVWTQVRGRLVELGGVAGYSEASIGQAFKQAFLFSFKNKTAIIARGTKAKMRFADAPTVLYTRYEPSEIGVVRFTVQTEENKNRRYVWVVSQVGSNQGEFYPPEDNVTFTDESTPDGAHKLTLNKALTPGEYGLIGVGGTTGYQIHDFGVDAQ